MLRVGHDIQSSDRIHADRMMKNYHATRIYVGSYMYINKCSSGYDCDYDPIYRDVYVYVSDAAPTSTNSL